MNQILIVDSQLKNCESIADMLAELDVSLSYSHSGKHAIAHIRDIEPSLVLLDAELPNINGYQLINQMWADDDLRQIPVLLMTHHLTDRKQMLHQPLLEVVDSLPKPINAQLLRHRVSLALTMRSHQKTIMSVLEDGGQAIRKRHEGVLAVNDEGIIIFANATALALLRTNHQIMFGVYLESLFEEPNQLIQSAWHDHPIYRMCSQGNILQVESCALYCADGKKILVKMAAIPMTVEGDISMVIAFRQIAPPTDAENTPADSVLMQQYDPLTGVYQRRAFEQVIDDRITRHQQTSQKMAILQIDLAHFNHVNETLGHSVGDQMLKDVVARIHGVIRPVDRIGRIGGDVFAVMIDDVQQAKAAGAVAQKIIDALKESFLLAGFELFIGCTLGIATYPECGTQSEALLKNAALAVNGAKLTGFNSYQFFTAKMNIEMLTKIELESCLHRSLDNGEIQVRVEPMTLSGANGQASQPDACAQAFYVLRLAWDHEKFDCQSTSQLLALFERHNASDIFQQVVAQSITQFMTQAQAQDQAQLILMVPVSLRVLMHEQMINRLVSLVPNIATASIGWLLQDNSIGRLLPHSQQTIQSLIQQGFLIGLESVNRDYIISCMTTLDISVVLLHQPIPVTEKQSMIDQALMQLAHQLNIAVSLIA